MKVGRAEHSVVHPALVPLRGQQLVITISILNQCNDDKASNVATSGTHRLVIMLRSPYPGEEF